VDLSSLRAVFRAQLGKAGRGEPVTELQAAAAMSAFLLYNEDGELLVPTQAPSLKAKARMAAALSGRSAATSAKLWRQFQEHGSIFIEQPGGRGPRRANEEELLIALEPLVKQHVRQVLLESHTQDWVTRRSLQGFIRDTTGVEVSLTAVSRLCGAWGLEYGRLRRPQAARTPQRLLQRDTAVLQLSKAVQARHLLMSVDESYANAGSTTAYSFYPASTPFATFAQPAGLGRRICFIQGIYENGLAGKPGDLVVGDITSEAPHAELMFAAQQRLGGGDYHGNFNHAVFMAWMPRRLIHWARHFHPHLLEGHPGALQARKLCIMLDNAPYHTGSTEHMVAGEELRFNPMSCTRKVLYEGLLLAGCPPLVVSHTLPPRAAATKTCCQ